MLYIHEGHFLAGEMEPGPNSICHQFSGVFRIPSPITVIKAHLIDPAQAGVGFLAAPSAEV